MDDTDKVQPASTRTRSRNGLAILPPDVNASDYRFDAGRRRSSIRYGLGGDQGHRRRRRSRRSSRRAQQGGPFTRPVRFLPPRRQAHASTGAWSRRWCAPARSMRSTQPREPARLGRRCARRRRSRPSALGRAGDAVRRGDGGAAGGADSMRHARLDRGRAAGAGKDARSASTCRGHPFTALRDRARAASCARRLPRCSPRNDRCCIAGHRHRAARRRSAAAARWHSSRSTTARASAEVRGIQRDVRRRCARCCARTSSW